MYVPSEIVLFMMVVSQYSPATRHWRVRNS